MRSIFASLLFAGLLPNLALAEPGTVAFPHSQIATERTVHYRCHGSRPLTVRYINTTDGDALAYLEVDGRPHIFVTTLSGSGAKYVSGIYTWWNKGNQGTLWTSPDPNAPPALAECQAQPEG
jgi:membrane-bound inhibitor of C-type lysozyme